MFSKILKVGYDNLKVEKGVVNGGKRAASIFIPLSDVRGGGEFIFPRVREYRQQSTQYTMGECATSRK